MYNVRSTHFMSLHISISVACIATLFIVKIVSFSIYLHFKPAKLNFFFY